jgi:hypothetical protein
LIGHGPEFWSKLRYQGDFGSASAYSSHNQWAESYLVAGLFGVVIFMLFLVAVLRFTESKVKVFAGAYLCGILSLGVLEAPISYSGVTGTTWALAALLMLCSQKETNPQSQRPELIVARK